MAGSTREDDLAARAQSGPPDEGLLTDNPILSPITSFVRGAYSFPFDWWLCIHWVLGMQGAYGARMQENCRRIGRDLDIMLNLALRTFPMSYRLTSVVVNYLLRDELTRCAVLDAALQRLDRRRALGGAIDAASGMAGRFTGGLFTLYASTGGRFGRLARTGTRRYGFMLSNLMLASTGSLIRLATETRVSNVTVADMAIVMFTGRAGAAFSNDDWRAIFQGVQQCSLTVNADDQETYRKIYETLDQFTNEVKQSTQ